MYPQLENTPARQKKPRTEAITADTMPHIVFWVVCNKRLGYDLPPAGNALPHRF